MKKKYLATALISLMLICVFLANEGMAAAVQPGSTADPLVSKSYVDDKINQVLALIGGGSQLPVTGNTVSSADTQEIVASVLTQIEFLYGDKIGAAASYIPVSAAKGQILLGGEGTEIILRSGKASGVCSGTNGIVDATDGTEILNGNEVKVNHMLIVPRGDGRGVVITQDAWFIVKGEYTLK